MINRKHAPAPLGVTITGDVHNGGRATLVFTWVPDDPLVVALLIHHREQEPVEWHFGRDLLIEYYKRGEAGEGDLRIYTDDGDPAKPDTSTIHLSSPEGEGWVDVPQPRLRAFACQMKDTAQQDATAEAVRIRGDLDATLAELCGAA